MECARKAGDPISILVRCGNRQVARPEEGLRLTAVELGGIGVLLKVLRASDRGRPLDAVLLAAGDDLLDVDGVDEEGGHGGADDEAVWGSLSVDVIRVIGSQETGTAMTL